MTTTAYHQHFCCGLDTHKHFWSKWVSSGRSVERPYDNRWERLCQHPRCGAVDVRYGSPRAKARRHRARSKKRGMYRSH